jgi:urate oxidase
MPNQHRIPFDLTPFGLKNENVIFVTTSEPFGMISGVVRRS